MFTRVDKDIVRNLKKSQTQLKKKKTNRIMQLKKGYFK